AQLVASDIIRSGFTAMLDGRSPGADEWLEKLEAYGRDYMTLGAAKLQQELAGDLVVLQQRLEDPHLWSVAARLMTLFGKTIPGADGAKAVQWYKMAAAAADRSHEMETRVWVRGRAAIALGYEGACLPLAESFAEQAIEICDRPSLGRLNAVMGKAHAAAIRGDRSEALRLNQEGQRIFDLVGSCDQDSDYSVPEWRMAVFQSLLMARMGEEKKAAHSQDVASKNLPVSLPRFATHIEMHRGLMLARSGDYEGGVRYAEQALNELPVERHSLTLRMLLEEIKKTPTS
ncbi:MAG: hypothetical protein QG608_3007, partial [Actinomycetota bacterium]|nr:hypothetical protein [Actinomycetota bacterium]